jgi:hypothetical protein
LAPQKQQQDAAKPATTEAREDLLNVLTRVRGYSTAATFTWAIILKREGGGLGRIEDEAAAADRIEHIEHIGDCHIKSFNGQRRPLNLELVFLSSESS